MENNNTNHAELLKQLLIKCLSDEKRFKEVYERPVIYNPFGFKRETNMSSMPLLERVEYIGKSNVIEKYDLNHYFDERPDFLDSLEIKFESKPPLKLFYNKEKTLATKKENTTKKSFEMKTFFGKVYQAEVEVCTITRKLIYTLSHGAIECDITGEEALQFLKTYHDNLLEFSKKLDLEKLIKRVNE